jgi:RNA polymerase sigma factor (sigma-70 family)
MSTKKESDVEFDELWQKFLSGDDESFDRLYDKFVRILFAFGLQFTYDRELVKDCIQDVFVKMYETRLQLYHVENANTFLRIALKNRIINAIKKEKTHSKFINTAEFSEIDDFTAYQNMEYYEEEQHNRNMIEAMLKLLTPQQKRVVQFRYFEDMSLEEISILLKINYQSVQNILQRAITKMRKHFESRNESILPSQENRKSTSPAH